MPTLLQINVVANWGSTGRIAEEIGQTAIAAGWRSVIAYGRGRPQSQSELIRIGNDWDMYEHIFESRLFDNQGMASRRATKRFIQQIEELKPDVIHLHNIHGHYLNYPLLFDYLKSCHYLVVWTLHDCWLYTGHCTHYSAIKCYRWKNGCYDCPQQRLYPISLFMERSEKNFLTKRIAFSSLQNIILVPVSYWLANEVKQSFMGNCRINVIYNGIDVNTFIPHNIQKSALNLENKFLIIGVANVWSRRKGLEDFIRLRKILSNDYQIALIGLTDKQIKVLPKGIIGINRTNSVEELVDYYSVAEVFLNLSTEETFGLTTVEAMACGIPIIVYNTTASPEIVNENTGFVVEQGDLKGLSNAIQHVCKKGKETYQTACRERAVKYFNKNDRYQEYIDLYNQSLSN
ncbi:MAG: glycosyltransferase, partial [Coprobacillus cateniformis]|nr:glycosyltransferase [Coprobacillus cateniformis]